MGRSSLLSFQSTDVLNARNAKHPFRFLLNLVPLIAVLSLHDRQSFRKSKGEAHCKIIYLIMIKIQIAAKMLVAVISIIGDCKYIRISSGAFAFNRRCCVMLQVAIRSEYKENIH